MLPKDKYAIIGLTNWKGAVSYTHLDVYKRQLVRIGTAIYGERDYSKKV